MDLLSTNKKEFYIDLLESRFFFPGDTIKGAVVLNLEKPTKTNHIRVTLTGEVQADGLTVQVLQTSWFLASSPENDGKAHMLEPQTHRFPFEFMIPHDSAAMRLPSSFKLSPLLGVNYTITAIHDRPYVPERLSALAKKEIRFLEPIDVTQPEYCARGHVYDVVQVLGLPDTAPKVRLALTLPNYAVVRGDILPLEIGIKHHQSLVRQKGIKVYLIRRVYSGKNRHKLSERKSIKSFELDLDIAENDNSQFEQTILTKLLIPTSTPPTISEGGRILSVDYSVRVVVNLNDPDFVEPHHENYIKLESSVVIGTFPKPSLSIDDDDDDEVTSHGEDMDALDEDDHITAQPILSISNDSVESFLAERTSQQLEINSKSSFNTDTRFDHASSLTQTQEPSYSPILNDSTTCPSSQSPSVSTSSSNSTTIIDPTTLYNGVNISSHQKVSSSSSAQNTIYQNRRDPSKLTSNNNPTANQRYEAMKPNRKSSISSISSLSDRDTSPLSNTVSPHLSLPPSAPPPIPIESRPQPAASTSSSTVSSFATTSMPDVAAYIPQKSPLLQQFTYSYQTGGSSASTYCGRSSPTFSANQIPPSSPAPFPPSYNSTYEPALGTPSLPLPTPYSSHQPPAPSPTNSYTSAVAGIYAMPMPMPDPTPSQHSTFYPTPPPPPPRDYYHNPSNPVSPPQHHFSNNHYYGPPSTTPHPSAPPPPWY